MNAHIWRVEGAWLCVFIVILLIVNNVKARNSHWKESQLKSDLWCSENFISCISLINLPQADDVFHYEIAIIPLSSPTSYDAKALLCMSTV